MYLGRNKYEYTKNEHNIKKIYRNGYINKNLRSSFVEVGLTILNDRNSEFEPQILKKYETVCAKLDKKIISFYAKGMITSDIKA
ncbi:transposase [Clostridium perfringens]|uniref:transposase n=1 Tax=Clostridium perfringens TaxID=1502 RepID=UPI0018E478E9|nr:transposase [Clostridium perfringens]